jgi:hypothetical protein
LAANVHYIIDDIEKEWMESGIDFIHARHISPCFRNCYGVLEKGFHQLNPGGFFEIQDILPLECHDGSWKGSRVEEWRNLVIQGAEMQNHDWEKGSKYRKWMEKIGFVAIQEKIWYVTINIMDEKYDFIAALLKASILEGLFGFSYGVLTQGVGMRDEEVQLLLAGVREDLRDCKIHCVVPL